MIGAYCGVCKEVIEVMEDCCTRCWTQRTHPLVNLVESDGPAPSSSHRPKRVQYAVWEIGGQTWIRELPGGKFELARHENLTAEDLNTIHAAISSLLIDLSQREMKE